jgi:hypothetical protein
MHLLHDDLLMSFGSLKQVSTVPFKLKGEGIKHTNQACLAPPRDMKSSFCSYLRNATVPLSRANAAHLSYKTGPVKLALAFLGDMLSLVTCKHKVSPQDCKPFFRSYVHSKPKQC